MTLPRYLLSTLIVCTVSLSLNETDPPSIDYSTPLRSLYLSSKPEFRQMAQEGTVPAWIDSTGSLMIPKITHPRKTLIKGRLRDARMSHKVAVPGLDNLFNPDRRFTKGRLKSRNDEEAYMQLISTYRCPECSGGLIFPSLTNPDGSDIFEYDVFEPGSETDRGSKIEETFDPGPPGCYYKALGYLVCHEKQLTVIPELPEELISLEMNETRVDKIQAKDFNGKKVVVMKLDFNAISNISEKAFRATKGLTKLSMENNRISSFIPSIFTGLESLKVLSLKANKINLTQDGIYPAKSYDPNYLPQLVYFNLAENPLGSLNQYIFRIFYNSPIEELNLQSCKLSYIHPDAFSSLKKLVHIDLFNNKNLIPELDAMSNTQLAGLIKLGLAGNLNTRLESLPNKLIQSFNATLIQLNLSGNLFPRLSSQVLAFCMPRLTALILNDCSISIIEDDIFTNFPKLAALYLARNYLKEMSSSILPPFLQTLSIRQNPPVPVQRKFVFRLDNTNDLKSLTWLDMNYVKLDTVDLNNLGELSGLRFLQLRDANIQEIAQGTFSKLNELVLLDLGENSLRNLPFNFSLGLNKLMTLFLDGCSLNLNTEDPSPFASLENLQQIFLNNNNNIEDFPPALIKNLMRLVLLDLSFNQLKIWHLGTTKFMSSQTNIDVSYNQITSFPANIFDEFKHIGAIDFSHNNFFCDCELRDLKRLAGLESNVTVLNWDDQSSYKCVDLASQERMNITDLNDDQFHCDVPSTMAPEPSCCSDYIATYIECATFAILFILSPIICYRKRDNVLQGWFWLRRRVTVKSTIVWSESDAYDYDAFISFNEHDRDWVYTYLVPQLESNQTKRNENGTAEVESPLFRLCLHDRDFMAGERITNNIIKNISKSRKVVIVLSRAFLESSWCQYELNLSKERLMEQERNDLVIILLEDIPKKLQNGRIRHLIRTRTYLAWVCDIEGQKLFWQRLHKVLLQQQNKTRA